MNRGVRWLAWTSLATLTGCAQLMPLREPPPQLADLSLEGLRTREDAVARLGRPAEIQASDLGQVLVYRRRVTLDVNPNRYYGPDRGDQLDRYEQIRVFLDPEGRVSRITVEPE